MDAADRARLDENLELAREMGAEVHCLKGGDFAATLLAFAREQRITQLFLGHSQRDRQSGGAADRRGRRFRRPSVSAHGDAMKHAGKLKVYLGYAAGVGKTYRMLDEAQTLRAQGVDVVIGYFETHGRKETIARTEGLEMVPRRVITYAGPVSRRWIRKPCCGASRRWPWWTSSHTATFPAARTRSAGRTCTNCSTPGSTC